MRILIVNTRHFRGGGDSTYAFNLAELLRSNGHTVLFFGMQDSSNLPDPNADLFVSPIDFRELNHTKNLINGAKVLGRVIYSREARQKFSALLDRVQPQIIHLQNIHSHITPSVIFEAKKRGLPVVWTLHDYKLICPNSHFLIDKTAEICEACGTGRYYQPLLKRCKKDSFLASGVASLEAYAHRLMRIRNRVNAFMAPSLFLANKLVDRGLPSEKVFHLPLFLPPDLFQANDVCGDYILFCGRLERVKGVVPLLEACRLVPDVKLILAGRLEAASQLLQMLPDNAQYVGMKSGADLWSLILNARAVVVPSLWYENQPFSILEAFARSRPVISTNLGGMAELVVDRERGLLVPPGDVASLAEAMRWMFVHAAEARDMGRRAYTYALAQHGAESHYQRLLNIYTQCLS